MRSKPMTTKAPAERVLKDIRRATRRHFSAEDKIRIVLDGLRGEDSIAELCRREGIAQSLYYVWSKEFLEAGKRRLAGDTARAATRDEVKDLRRESTALKEVVAEQALELRILKKSMIADGGRRGMRYPASEKIEIIRIVEQSPLSARRTLDQSGCHGRRSIAGTISIRRAGRKPWRIGHRRLAGSGTASPTPSGTGSSNSRWNNPSCHPANWRCDLATHRATSYPKPRFIVS